MTASRDHAMYTLTLAERIQHAIRRSGIPGGTIAEAIGVHKNTVSSWINGRTAPRTRDLALIAEMTGYPLEWLENGDAALAATIVVPSREAVDAIRDLADQATSDLVRVESEWGRGRSYDQLLEAGDADAHVIDTVRVLIAEWNRARTEEDQENQQ